jgi:hypothetical protein
MGHEGGHGAPIEGLGPNGGILSAVIAAKNASLGDQAPRVAIAEWKLQGNSLELRLLTEKKSLSPLSKSGEVKWILLRTGQKPEVIVRPTQAEQAKFSIELKDAKLLNAVEVILPDQQNEKLVTIVSVQHLLPVPKK